MLYLWCMEGFSRNTLRILLWKTRVGRHFSSHHLLLIGFSTHLKNINRIISPNFRGKNDKKSLSCHHRVKLTASRVKKTLSKTNRVASLDFHFCSLCSLRKRSPTGRLFSWTSTSTWKTLKPGLSAVDFKSMVRNPMFSRQFEIRPGFFIHLGVKIGNWILKSTKNCNSSIFIISSKVPGRNIKTSMEKHNSKQN